MGNTQTVDEPLKGKALNTLQNKYLKSKKLAVTQIKNFFARQFGSPSDDNLFEKLKRLAEEDGLIEIGFAYGDGDNGSGYYKAHLMLNLKKFEEKKFDDLVYLIIQYVPFPDVGHEFDDKEFSEITECNFTKALVLLQYMDVFTKQVSCRQEIQRLALREYPTCVDVVKAGGLSFC